MTSPSPTKPPSWYEQNPHAKISFSRLATYRRCPAWYRHQYLNWHRAWSTPVLRVGHVVQTALEKAYDGVPAEDVTLESLEERALARMEVYFDRLWADAQKAHEEDPNGFGPWDLPRDRYVGYLRQGLRWHLLEVVARLDGRHPRTGAALDLEPAESVASAWERVRPWHVKQGADFSESMETVPGGFFQGQYDLVYDWAGGRRIVDLKASKGSSAFSTEIELQLVAYAYLERELGRGRPEGIEGWFLGAGEPHLFDVPGDEELDAFSGEVVELIRISGSEGGFDAWNPSDFDPYPASPEGFTPAPGEPSAWCAYCPAAFTCPESAREAPPVGNGLDFEHPPKAGSIDLTGLVLGVAEARERSNGRVKQRFTVANASGAGSFTWDEPVVRRLISDGLRAGRVVRITDLRPWIPPNSDRTLFFDSRTTRLEVTAETWSGHPE